MVGAIAKSHFADRIKVDKKDIFTVSVMPCTAKKFEIGREEMIRHGIADVDVVITTRELARLIRLMGIDMNNIEPELTDSPLGIRSSAGKIFGASGGVMEAAIRTAHYKITGKDLLHFKVPAVRGAKGRKEAQLDIEGLKLGVAVVSGLKEAETLIKEIRDGRDDIHFDIFGACTRPPYGDRDKVQFKIWQNLPVQLCQAPGTEYQQ